jgi:hypothetical protein
MIKATEIKTSFVYGKRSTIYPCFVAWVTDDSHVIYRPNIIHSLRYPTSCELDVKRRYSMILHSSSNEISYTDLRTDHSVRRRRTLSLITLCLLWSTCCRVFDLHLASSLCCLALSTSISTNLLSFVLGNNRECRGVELKQLLMRILRGMRVTRQHEMPTECCDLAMTPTPKNTPQCPLSPLFFTHSTSSHHYLDISKPLPGKVTQMPKRVINQSP